MKKIVFYNSHQHGDLFLSKSIVDYFKNELGKKYEYYYLHNKNSKSLDFGDDVKILSLSINFHGWPSDFAVDILKKEFGTNNFYIINTWIGSIEGVKFKGYVESLKRYYFYFINDKNEEEELWITSKNQKILLEQLIRQYQQNLNEQTFRVFSDIDEMTLIPKYNHNLQDKFKVDQLVNLTSLFKKRIFICNGDTHSFQRENFEYKYILSEFIKENSNIAFIFSDFIENFNEQNVFYFSNFYDIPNLNQIEYFYAYCDAIISSFSGPGVVLNTDKVLLDSSKTIVFLMHDDHPLYTNDYKCKIIRSSNFEKNNIVNLLNNII